MNTRRSKYRSEDFGIIARAGNVPDAAKLPEPESECRIQRRYLPFFELPYPCGHRGPIAYKLSFYGQKGKLETWPRSELCPECLLLEARKNIAQCALCGLPIFPGSPVVVYKTDSFDDLDTIAAAYADETKTGVLGCMRWDCCECHGFFSGHYLGEEGFSPFDFEKHSHSLE